MLYSLIGKVCLLLEDEFKFLDMSKGIATNGLVVMGNKVNQLGSEAYDIVFKFSVYSCIISFIGIVIARLIFRIASPREDARAKSIIQGTLVITFVISMVATLFQIVINLAQTL